MARPFIPLNLNKFVGENDTTPSAEIEDAAGYLIQNLYLVNNGLERRLGQTLVNTAQTAADGLQGLSWCRVPALTPVEYVVGVRLGTLYDFYNAGVKSAPTALTGGGSRFNTTSSIDMGVVDSKLYAADGVNPMVRFDGTSVKKSGSSPPTTAPTFNAFVGAGVMTGNVQYKVVYLDADGNESEASAASAVLSPVAQNITLNLPNDTDADRSGKNLYRLGVASTVYKLVNSSPLAASATTYTDSVADASLGLQLVTGNTLMPSCTHVWEHDGRLFGCGNAALPNTLFISNQFQPWYCPSSPNTEDPTQGVRLQIQGKNARLVGGISHGGFVFVFTDSGGYILQGTTQDDYRLDAFTNHGCASHRSIKSIRNWLLWVGPEGIFRYGGYEGTYSGISGYDALGVTRIDNPILQFFASKSGQNLAQSVAWVYNNRYYIGFPSDGSGTPGQPGGGIAPVDPATLTHLELYFDGRTGITSSVGVVSKWADQSGNARDLAGIPAGATGPTVVTSPTGLVAGVQALKMSSSPATIIQNKVLPTFATTRGYTHYILSRISIGAGTNTQPIINWPNGAGSMDLEVTSPIGTGRTTLRVGATLFTVDLGLAPTFYQLWALVFDTANSQVRVYLNGAVVGMNAWTPAQIQTQLDLGGTSAAPNIAVEVAAYLMFTATHDTTSVKAVSSWFLTHFGVG